jgi:hypothetical protein
MQAEGCFMRYQQKFEPIPMYQSVLEGYGNS